MRDNENVMAADENISTVREQLSEIIEDDKIADILGRECVEQLKEFRAQVDKRCEEPFTLVILGDFKRGKSTIINALLGKKLAPINVTPETYTINEISFGHTQTVEAILENGQRVPLVLEDITRENLEKRMKLFPAKISCVQIKDNAPILKSMRIVDTPGLSDLESLDKQVQDYIVNADAIMYAASCLLPFSESEQVFLATHVSPQRFGMLYVLVNMIDALNSMADVNKIMRRFRGISERIVPNAFVYGISGGDELKRKLGEERPEDRGTREFYETQFFQFELSLERDIIMQKDVIRSKRVLTMLDRMHAEISSRLRMISDMAEMDKQLLEDKAREFERQCDDLAAELEKRKPVLHLSILEMQQEAETWMYEFFAKLRTSILECRAKDEMGEDIYSPEDIEKYFYSFLMEKVGEAYRTCIECHRDAITELTDKMSRELASALGITNVMMSANKNVTRSVMGVKLFGTSENFSPAAMSTFSLIMKKKKQTDIIDIALENYDEIRINIVKDIKTVYQDLEVKAISRLESLYKYQVELSRNAIDQAKEMVDNDDKSELLATLSDALKRLEAPKKILDANLPA
jgi:GTPase SAR1 family protein